MSCASWTKITFPEFKYNIWPLRGLTQKGEGTDVGAGLPGPDQFTDGLESYTQKQTKQW
jgi:hypothetical protein